MTPRQALVRAIAYFGSEALLGEAIGFTQNSIYRAKTLGRPTADMAHNIHVATGGDINRAWLRPDLFGPELKMVKHSWSRCRPRARRVGHRAA